MTRPRSAPPTGRTRDDEVAPLQRALEFAREQNRIDALTIDAQGKTIQAIARAILRYNTIMEKVRTHAERFNRRQDDKP